MKTIDITTTQKVTIEYELAGLRDRFLATIIDMMIIGFAGGIFIAIFSSAVWDQISDGVRYTNRGSMLISFLIPMFIFLCYHFFSELLMDGQSFGKRAVGIKVIKLNGKEAGASDYLLRTLFHSIDNIMCLGVLCSLLVISSDKSQRLGDLAANTAVIKVKFNLRFRLEDILKINSIADYEPIYPEVRQFSEQDMLLIKSVVTRQRMYNNPAHRDAVNILVRDLMLKLDILDPPKDKIHFLKTLIRDYIVLTR